MHEPGPVRCTVVPLIVQFPDAMNDTGRPEDAVADTSKSGSPYTLSGSGPKSIVWLCLTGPLGSVHT